jgi:hypothetical protein
VEQDFHPARYSPASNLCGIFASDKELKGKVKPHVDKEGRLHNRTYIYIHHRFLGLKKKKKKKRTTDLLPKNDSSTLLK